MSLQGNDSPEFLQAVGRVAVSFGRLEFQVSFLTHCLIGDTPQVGQTITSAMQIGPILELAARVGRIRFASADGIRALDKLLDEIKVLSDKRHAVVHAFFGPEDADGNHVGLRLRSRGRDVLKVSNPIVNASDLDKIADEAEALWSRIHDFMDTLPPDLTKNYISRA